MLEALKQQVLDANRELPRLGLVEFTLGNVSGPIAIEPSGVPDGDLVARLFTLPLRVDPGLPPMPQCLLDRHSDRKHGPGAYYGQR